MSINIRALVQKLEAPPAEHIAEIEGFVDFLRLCERERALTGAAAAASAPAFAEVWGNPEDDACNLL